MKFSTLMTLLICAFCVSAHGETDDRKKAKELGMQAIQIMDAGQIEESIQLLEESKKLDPESILYPYEIAYAHYLNKDYKQAVEILKSLLKHPQVNARIYQMLGNALDMGGHPEKAIQAYELGIKKFPAAGSLYLERGGMAHNAGNLQDALEYYEKGIQADPKFPSNYFRATLIYMDSTEKVWGMLYGEIFMNLERGSERTAEISKLLYDTCKSQILFTSETSYTIDFTRNSTIRIPAGGDPSTLKIPFELGIYEPLLVAAVLGEKSITLDSLHRIRAAFLEGYYNREFQTEYPNALFDYQRNIEKKGHLEAYNHWLLMKGDEPTFDQWVSENKDAFNKFTEWYSSNPIEITRKSFFHSSQYQ